MTHLTDGELVDAVDGSLTGGRAAHLTTCAGCRDRVEIFRESAAALNEPLLRDVPEPSPLFWEHFSRRVHEAVADTQAARLPLRWFRRPVWAAALGAAVVVAVVLLSRDAPRGTLPHRSPEPPATSPAASTAIDPGTLEWESDEDWALVRVVFDDLLWEDAPDAGLDSRPGSAERVALEMSTLEREELARLIELELKRPGA